LEQELDRARQQGLYIGGGVDTSQLGFGGATNSGIRLPKYFITVSSAVSLPHGGLSTRNHISLTLQ